MKNATYQYLSFFSITLSLLQVGGIIVWHHLYITKQSMEQNRACFRRLTIKSEYVKVQVRVFYSLILSLKTYHIIGLYSSPPASPDLFIHVPFQFPGEHTVLQPFRRIELIVHIAISVLPGTHFHLSQVKHLRVKSLAQGHNILTISQDWEGRNMIFLRKSCTKRDSKPRDSKRQSATL